MKKIVIVTRQADNDNGLIKLLNGLFPECEIRTVLLNTADLEACLSGSLSGSSITGARGGNRGKHFERK